MVPCTAGLLIQFTCPQIAVLREGNPVFSLHVDFEPQCASVHPGQTEVAVGGKTVSLLRLSCCCYRGTQRENKKKNT